MRHKFPVEQRIYVSTSCLGGNREINSVLGRLFDLGIHRVELTGPHPSRPVDLLIMELQKWRQQGMFFIIHNYFPPPANDFVLNLASFDENTSLQTKNLIISALKLAAAIDSPIYGCHSGYLADAIAQNDGTFQFLESRYPLKDCTQQTAAVIQEIISMADAIMPPRGILLENLFPPENGENHSIARTPEEIELLFSLLPDHSFNLLLDLAHLELTCSLAGFSPDDALNRIIEKFADRIYEVHISGHDGKKDLHTPLTPDSWQVGALKEINSARNIPDDIIFTLESRNLPETVLLQQIELITRVLS